MDKIKVEYDFNAYLKWGWDSPVPLSLTDYVIDSNGDKIVLSEGIDIRIYEIDYDIFNRQDNLYADGIVISNPTASTSYSDFKWWFQINDIGAKHESDNPDFKLPELAINEKRNIIYEHMQKCMSLESKLKDTDKQRQIKFFIEALRKIDNGEL